MRTLACFVLSVTVTLAAGAQDVPRLLASAHAEVEKGRLDEAMALVDTVLAADPRNFDARFLKARIHSWQGSYGDAETGLNALVLEAPANLDVRVAQANLFFYQGKKESAAAKFRAILKRDPGNVEAKAGLERSMQALMLTPQLWRVDGGFEYSSFARRPQPAWNQAFIQGARTWGGSTTMHVRADHFYQFKKSDVSVELGLAHRLSDRTFVAALAGWTPASDFKPEARFLADAGHRIYSTAASLGASDGAQPGPLSVWVLGTLAYDDYDAVIVWRTTPGLRVEVHRDWALTARVTRVDVTNEDGQYGGLLRMDGPLPAKAFFYGGYADAPETIAGQTIATRSLFAGVLMPLGRGHSVNLGYARDDRENSYVRHALNAGFTHKF